MFAVYALVAWTVFVWGTRVSNIVGGTGSNLDLGLALVLCGLALAVGFAAWRRSPRWPLVALVVGTVATWVVRTPLILFDADRGVPFKTVHLVLAAVSVALAVVAWRSRDAMRATNEHQRRPSPARAGPPRSLH